MLWFVETYQNIVYTINAYLGIDITLFTDFQKLVIIIGCNIMVLITNF